MSATPSDRTGRFGRHAGSPPPVPFVKTLLPGVTAVNAVKAAGQCIARFTRKGNAEVFAGITQESDTDRHAFILRTLTLIGKGKLTAPTGERTIVTGKTGIDYSAKETCAAILAAFSFLDRENPEQAVRYRARVAGELDRAIGQGRAGENPIGWSDASANEAALKRASEGDIARARAMREARSGPENSPYAKFVSRSAAEAARSAAEAARAERAKTRAAKPKGEARKGASEQGVASKVRRPSRKGKAADSAA